MDYRNTIRSQFTGYISSGNNDNSFSSSVQPHVQLENNVITVTFSGYKVAMQSRVMTDSNNNVVEDQRPGMVVGSLPTTLIWNLEYPSGSTDLTNGNYMHFGYELEEITEE